MATVTITVEPNTSNQPSEAALQVMLVLDRTGSMNSVWDDTIGAFNTYVSKLAADTPNAVFSAIQFDTQGIDLMYDKVPIKEVKPLTRAVYVPRASTNLYDAIGNGVTRLDAITSDRKALVILTDGQENSSHEYTKDAIKKMLDDRQDNKDWLVIYLGANQDAMAEGSKFGTKGGRTVSFKLDSIDNAMGSASASTARYASAQTAKLGKGMANFTPAERRSSGGGTILDKDIDDLPDE